MMWYRNGMRSIGGMAAAAALGVAVAGAVDAQSLSAAAERGKAIYTRGEAVGGAPISVLVARSTTPLSGSLLPCVGCHGQDGKGRPEGAVTPSDIRWSSLSAPSGHRHDYGRNHPTFDELAFKRTVLTGRDPAGNALDQAMPRFDMSDSDFDDLIAYLKAIERDLDPGISADAIRVGTLVPLEGPLAGAGVAIRKTLEAYFADVNAAGGIHGRRLELAVGGYAADSTQAEWNLRDLASNEKVFALVGGYFAGLEQPLVKLATEQKLPVVGPFTLAPPEDAGRHSFFLLGGIVEQTRALAARLGAEASQRHRVAILHASGDVYRAAALAAVEQFRDRATLVLQAGFNPAGFDAAAAADVLRQSGATAVIFLGPAEDLKRLAAQLALGLHTPDLLLPGVFAGPSMLEISPTYGGRVLVGYSSMPSDHTPRGVEAFERLHSEHGLDYENSSLQISAFVAAEVLVEGLKRAGRELRRERLVEVLEQLSDFDSGLMPPLRYHGGRRIGALGAYVVRLDLENKSVPQRGDWLDLDK